jgi:hypothetical protein
MACGEEGAKGEETEGGTENTAAAVPYALILMGIGIV